MSRQEEALACAIARHHFKNIVGETVRLVLLHPGSTLSSLSDLASPFFEKLSAERSTQFGTISDKQRFNLIRDSLAVLYQHGIAHHIERVTFDLSKRPRLPVTTDAQSKNPTASQSRTRIEYYCNTETILYRPRIPLFLGFIRRRFGELGQAVIRALFERGRLTSYQLFKSTLASKLPELGITEVDAETCLTDMVQSGVVHWYGKRKRKSNYTKFKREDEAEVDDAGSKRKKPEVDNFDDDDDTDDERESDNTNEMINVGREEHVRIVGAPTRNNDKDIWGICFWHFNREYRNECCLMVVRNRISNELAVLILRVGLQIALTREDCEQPSEDFETTEIHADDIRKGLEDFDVHASLQEFWDAARILAKYNPPFVIAVPAHVPTHLKFVPGRLVAETRHKTVEEIILSRYGAIGKRIFRALALEGAMEEKILAEKCMLPLKLLREQIFRMYQDRIITAQEVPRSNDQQRASNWFYLWRVNVMSIHRNLLEVMYKTTLNLFLQHEMLNRENKTQEEKKKIDKHEALIISSILRVDQSIMVMRDFGPISAAYFPSKYEILDGYIMASKKSRRQSAI